MRVERKGVASKHLTFDWEERIGSKWRVSFGLSLRELFTICLGVVMLGKEFSRVIETEVSFSNF